MRLQQLSYANENQPRFTRWIIRSIEGLSGRDRYWRLYQIWSREVVPQGRQIFSKMFVSIFALNGRHATCPTARW